jgi:PPOX class probable F420-dependent enzyme
MVAIPASVREVIESGRLAHYTTLNADGSPQVTCVWVGLDGDEIVMGHLPEHRKVKNVRRDARVALSIEAEGTNATGLQKYLVVYGRARVTDGGAPELLQRLAHRYLGPDVRFPPMPNPPQGYITRISPERYGGVGPWAERGGD